MLRGRVGRALIAIRDNEIVAERWASTSPLQDRAFAVSAAYAGIAGRSTSSRVGFVSPESFTVMLSFALPRGGGRGWPGDRLRGRARGALHRPRARVRRRRRRGAGGCHLRDRADPRSMYLERGGLVGIARRAAAAPSKWKTGVPGQRVRRHAQAREENDAMVTGDAVCGALALRSRFGRRLRTRRGAAAAGWAARHHRQDRSSSAASTRSRDRPPRTARSAGRPRPHFDWVNSKGGVNGRKVEFVVLDDGYHPAKAVADARRLVEQDKVFALFNTLGTADNLRLGLPQPAEGAAALRRHRRVGVGQDATSTRGRSAGSPTT